MVRVESTGNDVIDVSVHVRVDAPWFQGGVRIWGFDGLPYAKCAHILIHACTHVHTRACKHAHAHAHAHAPSPVASSAVEP